MANYYKHSGKIAPQGLIFGLLLGAAVSVPASFLYDYGIFTIPEAKLRGFCTLVFGALIGAVSGAAMCWGKVRNKLGIRGRWIRCFLPWTVRELGHLDPAPSASIRLAC